jgi:hypothetical protein
MSLVIGSAVTIDPWIVFKACKDSSKDIQRLAPDVGDLYVNLRETKEYLEEVGDLSSSRNAKLVSLIEACNSVLADLEIQLKAYEKLGTQAQLRWDNMRWGLKDAALCRGRLISINTWLSIFNANLAQ